MPLKFGIVMTRNRNIGFERFCEVCYGSTSARFCGTPPEPDALSQLSKLSPHPYVILLSPTSDNPWDELARYDLSAILVFQSAVILLFGSRTLGWLLWRSQQQVRQPGTRNL